MSEITTVYLTTPPPLPQWYLNQFPEMPEKDVRWIWPPPEYVLQACRKLTELSKTLKYYRHDH